LSIDHYQTLQEAFVPLRGDFDSMRILGSAEAYCSVVSVSNRPTRIAEAAELAAILILDAGFTLLMANGGN
jgi:hypothetical protein